MATGPNFSNTALSSFSTRLTELSLPSRQRESVSASATRTSSVASSDALGGQERGGRLRHFGVWVRIRRADSIDDLGGGRGGGGEEGGTSADNQTEVGLIN